jgi:hypothetical protein
LLQVSPVPRAEEALEGVTEGSLLQGGEDATAVIVHHDQAQVGSRLAGADRQAGRVVHEGKVAQQAVGRPAVRQCRADGGRRGAVDAARAPAGQHPHVRAIARLAVIDVTYRHAGAHPQQRAFRERSQQVTGEPRLGQRLILVENLIDRGEGCLIGPPPVREP